MQTKQRYILLWTIVVLCHNSVALASRDSGYMLEFDGIDDFVSHSNCSQLNLTDQVTLEAWVKPEAYPDYTYQMIARKGSSYYLGIYGKNPFCNIYTNYWKSTRSRFNLCSNTWYHLAMTYDKNKGGFEANDLSSFDSLKIDSLLVPNGNATEFDQNIREIGNVLYEPNCPDPNKRYKIFYSGYNGALIGNNEYIGYAYSADGNNWTKFGKVISRSAEDPYVVNNNGVYYLYAEDKEDVPFRNIRLYLSNDCETWTDMGDVFDIQEGGNPPNWQSQDVSSPVVWREGDTNWHMLYEGRGGGQWGLIGLAHSNDGFYWTRDGNDPVMVAGDPGTWDETNIVPDDIVKIDGVYYLLYHGYGSSGPTGFWEGMATSTDLYTWNRYKWNPIMTSADTLMYAHDGHYGMVGELVYGVPEYGIYRCQLYVASSPHLYVNGVERPYISRSDCGNAQIHTDDEDFTIGKAPTGTPYIFQGLIDDVFLWNKALDQNEIEYSVYGDIDYNDSNLVAYWSFNEINGYTAYDASINGLHNCLGGNCCAWSSSDPERVHPTYTWQPRSPRSICENCELSADFSDLGEMADNWLSVVTKCSEGDRNEDEVVDFFDFAILANHWFLEEYP